MAVLLPVVVPSLAAAAVLVSTLGDPISLWGDRALEQTAVHQAAGLRRSLGPHSNWRFFHPGPVMFYGLTPWYLLTGAHPVGLSIGALVMNTAWAVAIVAVARRVFDRLTAIVTAGLLALLYLSWSGPGMWEHWNPALVPVPLLLTTLLCVAAWKPSWRSLLAATVPASFVVQTHLSALPFVAAVVAMGTIGMVVAHRGAKRTGATATPSAPAGRRAWVVPAAIVTAVVAMWVPPLAEQVTAAPGEGNLSRIASVVRSGPAAASPEWSPSQVWNAVVTESTRVPFRWAPAPWPTAPFDLAESRPSTGRRLWWFASIGTAVAACAWSARTGRRFVLGLSVSTLALSAAAVVVAMRITGALHNYQLWGSMVSLLPVWIGVSGAVGGAVARRLPVMDRRRVEAVALSMAAVPALLFCLRLERPAPDSLGEVALQAATIVAPELADGAPASMIWDVAHADVVPGVVATLLADGSDVRVAPWERYRFGDHFVADGTEPIGIILARSEASSREVRDLADTVCVPRWVGDADGIGVWVVARTC